MANSEGANDLNLFEILCPSPLLSHKSLEDKTHVRFTLALPTESYCSERATHSSLEGHLPMLQGSAHKPLALLENEVGGVGYTL
jgi:hypothetical protein